MDNDDLRDDGSPFTERTDAFQKEEKDLAEFVVHETPEERIKSFVEDFADAYKEDPEEVYMLLDDIYEDLDTSGHVPDREAEIMEVLKRLKQKTGV